MSNQTGFDAWKGWLTHASGSKVRVWEDNEGMESYVTYAAPDKKRFLQISFYIADGCMYLDAKNLAHWSTPHGAVLSEDDKQQALRQTKEMISSQSDWSCEISSE